MLAPERLWTVTLAERNMREWRDPKFEVGGRSSQSLELRTLARFTRLAPAIY